MVLSQRQVSGYTLGKFRLPFVFGLGQARSGPPDSSRPVSRDLCGWATHRGQKLWEMAGASGDSRLVTSVAPARHPCGGLALPQARDRLPRRQVGDLQVVQLLPPLIYSSTEAVKACEVHPGPCARADSARSLLVDYQVLDPMKDTAGDHSQHATAVEV